MRIALKVLTIIRSRKEKLISIEKVKEAAINAKAAGSTRFCLGAAWRSPTDNDLNTYAK